MLLLLQLRIRRPVLLQPPLQWPRLLQLPLLWLLLLLLRLRLLLLLLQQGGRGRSPLEGTARGGGAVRAAGRVCAPHARAVLRGESGLPAGWQADSARADELVGGRA